MFHWRTRFLHDAAEVAHRNTFSATVFASRAFSALSGPQISTTRRQALLMAIVLIACLIGLSLYLAKRLNDVNAQNTALQGQITSLKKQLARTRPGSRA